MSWSVNETGLAGEVRAKLRDAYINTANYGMPAQEAHVVQYVARAVEAAVSIMPEGLEIKVESFGSCTLDGEGNVTRCNLSLKVEPF